MMIKRIVSTLIKHLFLIATSLICVFPFLWMLISMTNKSADIAMGKLSIGTHLIDNLTNAFRTADLGRAFANSLFLSTMITVASIVICSAAGYAFVVYRSRRTEPVFMILITSMMVPFAAKVIPMYRMFAQMKLLNSYWCIFLPAVGAPFLIFFFRQNSEGFPVETIQAARVDGCSEFGIFVRIFMPMMKSTYSAAAIFSFMAAWNNYMWPLIALQSESKYTLPLAVSNLANGFTPDYGMIMVGIVISTVPTIIIFFALQKGFVEGILGSVK